MQPSRPSLEALLSKFESIKGLSEELTEEIKASTAGQVKTKRILTLVESYKEAKTWASYNIWDVGQFLHEVKDEDLYLELPNLSLHQLRVYVPNEEALNILYGVLQGCKTAILPLKSMLNSEIPLATLNKLTSLRGELEELNLDPDLMRNLEETIDESEHAHHLACAMMAGRVVQYLIAKAPGINVEEKARRVVELMIEKRMVLGDEKAKEAELRQMLRIEKTSRDMVSHNIHYWPRAEDAIMLLGGAIKLARLLGS